jgi:hypothetical protein
MRTTILLDVELAAQLRARARAKGQSLSAFLAEAGRAALKADPVEKKHTFELLTYGDSGTYPGIDLDKTNALLAAEDEGAYRS